MRLFSHFSLALFALALIALANAAARAAAPIASVPYSVNEEGSITVNVTIDGRGPYEFIVDTGATITLAFEKLAAIETFEPTGDAARRVLGISGSAVLDPKSMGDVAVGPAVMKNHVGVVLPDWDAPRTTPHGILGIDFFRQYAVVFDVDARTMTLYPHGGLPDDISGKWRRVRLQPRSYANVTGELFTTEGRLNGETVTFIIDLGSVSSLVNYEAADALFTSSIRQGSASGMITGSRLKDIFDDRTITRTGRFNKVRVGRVEWRGVTLWMKDAPIFEELGVAHKPYGLLGLDLLARRNFALDFGEDALYVTR